MKLRTLFLLLLLLWAAIGFSQNAAILFDGTMDEVYMGDLAFSSTSYTAECWIYPTNLPAMTGTDENYCRTIFASSQLAGSYPVWIGTNGNKLKVWSYSTNQDTGGQLVGGTLSTNT